LPIVLRRFVERIEKREGKGNWCILAGFGCPYELVQREICLIAIVLKFLVYKIGKSQ
jgi:hypothetical protein